MHQRIVKYNEILAQHGFTLPQDPYLQLSEAIIVVLKSWMSKRASYYRKLHNISESLGTAVNIQSMVFGNMGMTSGTGVLFTRNPSTGAKEFYGEFLLNAQGEDIVSGAYTPRPISPKQNEGESLKDILPNVYQDLKSSSIEFLENHFLDMQDIEFTIEQEQLYILQTRSAKRTAAAAIKIVVDMVSDDRITKSEALLKIDPESLNQLLHASIDRRKNPTPIAKGLPASPGAVSGIVVFSPHEAEHLSQFHKVILVRDKTKSRRHTWHACFFWYFNCSWWYDISRCCSSSWHGQALCMRRTRCFKELNKKEAGLTLYIDQYAIKQGDYITIDGESGDVFIGVIDTVGS